MLRSANMSSERVHLKFLDARWLINDSVIKAAEERLRGSLDLRNLLQELHSLEEALWRQGPADFKVDLCESSQLSDLDAFPHKGTPCSTVGRQRHPLICRPAVRMFVAWSSL